MKRHCFVVVASCISFVMMWFAAPQGALAGTRISYEPFVSTLYPYRLLQPSSFQHIVLIDLAGRKVDYFYPALGSSVTNVNIYEEIRGQWEDESYLMSTSGARRVHVSGYMRIGGKLVAIVSGDRRGLAGYWREESAEFTKGRNVWHLTMSYLIKYRAIRPTMMHMLNTFQLL